MSFPSRPALNSSDLISVSVGTLKIASINREGSGGWVGGTVTELDTSLDTVEVGEIT